MIDKNKLPQSWTIAKLGEVCTYSKGKMPQILKTEKNNECSIPYINIKAFEKGIFAEYTNGVKCNLCADGDLLMVWDGARCGMIGKAKKGVVGSTLMKILPTEIVFKEYLFHFLSSKFSILNTNPKGVGIPHIEPTLLWNFEFPIPPLPEQHRIVSKIEELFTDLAQGIESLKTTQQQLKVYRQAVLKWAFEGKLTNKNVVDGELPKGWEMVKFIEFCKLQRGYDLPLKNIIEGKYPVVTSSGINGYHNEFRANGPCLITGRSGGVGNIHFIKVEKYWPHNTALFVKDFCNNIPDFVYYFFLQFNFKSFSASTTIPTLDRKQLYNELLKLPPIKEQHRIVSEIETRLSVCDKIEETIENILQQAEALRLSILKKAFEGKLVKQNPKDESAEILLAKLRAEIKRKKV